MHFFTEFLIQILTVTRRKRVQPTDACGIRSATRQSGNPRVRAVAPARSASRRDSCSHNGVDAHTEMKKQCDDSHTRSASCWPTLISAAMGTRPPRTHRICTGAQRCTASPGSGSPPSMNAPTRQSGHSPVNGESQSPEGPSSEGPSPEGASPEGPSSEGQRQNSARCSARALPSS